MYGVGIFYKLADARDTFDRPVFGIPENSIQASIKDGHILKLNIRKKMIFDVKQSRRFAEAVEAENKSDCQQRHREERRRYS